ncbi:MAG: exodeoxyribonuclease VII small subunit [Chloroflexi bacterium]|nr:exodeoxyribonuclease VII small subunit [Chloroflexota bacterium]
MKEAKLSFEELLGRLEETVRALEAGGLSLDEATRLFEQGVHLAGQCHQILASAELKVSRLQRAFGEQMSLMQEEEE